MSKLRKYGATVLPLAVVVLVSGCSSSSAGREVRDENGGAAGAAAGGTSETGGISGEGTGGAFETGGSAGEGIGGTSETGGTAGEGTGGASETGGSAGEGTGGASEIGGSAGEGTGGTSETGGSAGDGTGGASATGGSAGNPATGGSGGSTDVTYPTVVNITPAADSTGIEFDTPVVIEFSEPMDRESVAGAVTVSGVDPAGLELSWNASSTTLTVSAVAGWPYAEGTNYVLTDAHVFAVDVTTSATDVAGNELDSSASSSFSTLRRITETVNPSPVFYYNSYSDILNVCDSTFEVGYLVTTVTQRHRAIFALDGSLLPTEEVVIENATATFYQNNYDSGYYDTGSIVLDLLGPASYSAGSDVDETVILALGTVFSSGASSASVDITAQAEAYWPAEHYYRLSPENVANGDDATLDCTIDVALTYLTP